jgi:hypothetical protein
VKINGLDCIVAMPRSVKYRLSTDPSARSDFTRTFTNFLDVSDGPQHAKAATRYGSFAASLFGGAYQKLSTLPPLLTGSRPIAAVLDPAHLTVEMFLKGFLAVHDGLTEKTAIGEYRHDLPKLLERCQVLAPAVDFGVTIADLSVFPGMGARYGEMDCTPVEMWRAFSCALAGGASVTRALFGTQIVLGPDQLRSA